MKIQNRSSHDNNEESKSYFFGRQRAVHEWVKYPCKQCNHQASSKPNLAHHQRAVHQGVKKPCRQCIYQATTKVRGKSHWTQNGITWLSQIPLQAMHLSSNYNFQSCQTSKGSTWRNQEYQKYYVLAEMKQEYTYFWEGLETNKNCLNNRKIID